jgi:hypothetical protein
MVNSIQNLIIALFIYVYRLSIARHALLCRPFSTRIRERDARLTYAAEIVVVKRVKLVLFGHALLAFAVKRAAVVFESVKVLSHALDKLIETGVRFRARSARDMLAPGESYVTKRITFLLVLT